MPDFDDVVIIGAPRSGTNMLRDVLTSLPGFTTWSCDEINPIWKHGNRSHPSDELTAAMATPDVASYIRRRFDRVRAGGGSTVVEKTCANSLRVEFVRAVLPRARFVLITRDGIDAAHSALGRWNAPLDLRYTAAKAKFVPPGDLPYYGAQYLRNRRRSRTSGPTGSWWGPKPDDYRGLLMTRPLDEIAVLQWQRCVDVAERGVDGLSSERLIRIGYEDFVRAPETGLVRLLGFLGRSDAMDAGAVAGVTDVHIGKGRAAVDGERRERWTDIAGSTLARLGYPS